MQSPVSNLSLKQPVDKVPGGKIIKNCVHLIGERAIGMSAAKLFNDGDFFWETEEKGKISTQLNALNKCLLVAYHWTHVRVIEKIKFLFSEGLL